MLYLFLSLMLSYLNCEDAECEYQLITYLEKQPPMKNSWPLSWMCGEELPKGREFLRCAIIVECDNTNSSLLQLRLVL